MQISNAKWSALRKAGWVETVIDCPDAILVRYGIEDKLKGLQSLTGDRFVFETPPIAASGYTIPKRRVLRDMREGVIIPTSREAKKPALLWAALAAQQRSMLSSGKKTSIYDRDRIQNSGFVMPSSNDKLRETLALLITHFKSGDNQKHLEGVAKIVNKIVTTLPIDEATIFVGDTITGDNTIITFTDTNAPSLNKGAVYVSIRKTGIGEQFSANPTLPRLPTLPLHPHNRLRQQAFLQEVPALMNGDHYWVDFITDSSSIVQAVRKIGKLCLDVCISLPLEDINVKPKNHLGIVPLVIS